MKANHYKSLLVGIAFFSLVTNSAFGSTKDISNPLTSLAKTHIELQVCSDTARSYQRDEISAQKYQEAASELYSRSLEVGWTEMELAAAMVRFLDVMGQSDELVVQSGDTKREFQLRNFTGDRCESQLKAAREFLEGTIPKPDR